MRSVLDWLALYGFDRAGHRQIKMATSGYCVKCKAKREMKDPKSIVMKNGRKATQGTCPVCGTKIFKIGG